MKTNIDKKSMQERLEHLVSLISSPQFLKMQGLGNEIPFFICPYKPEQAIEMARLQEQLLKRMEQAGIQVLEINLYDLSIEIIQERGIWEQVLETEESVSKAEFQELLQGVLDPQEYLTPAIARKIASCEFDVLFLSGIGEVFPYIRSHNVLNNLQSTIKTRPMVMFFPGDYTHSPDLGASLELFSRLHDDNYYRAFNIHHCEIRAEKI